MQIWPVAPQVPSQHRAAIGQIITRWAYFEWLLKEIAYKLLRLTAKEGRIAVREPRIVDYITMIEDLIELRGLTIATSFKHLRKSLERCETTRDWLAHGIWLRNPRTKEYRLRLIKGNWQPDPKKKGVSRKKVPQAIPATPARLKKTNGVIDTLIWTAGEMDREIDRALAASLQK